MARRSAASVVRRAMARVPANVDFDTNLTGRLEAAGAEWPQEAPYYGNVLVLRHEVVAVVVPREGGGGDVHWLGDSGFYAARYNSGFSPRAGEPCPRCGETLLSFSPSGNGHAACDECQTYWE